MKRRMAVFILIITIVVLSIFTQSTFAWFTDAAYSKHTYEIGDIKYVFSGELNTLGEDQVVVPGEPLISSTNLFLTNQSNIDTNLRMQIRFYYTDQITHLPVEEIYSGSGSGLNTFMDISMVTSWIYNATDQCWHFQYDGGNLVPATTTIEGYAFDIINNIAFNGEIIDNTLSGAIFKLQLIFQAKQASYVDWQTIGTEEIEGLAG